MRPRNNIELVNKDRTLLKFIQTCEQVGLRNKRFPERYQTFLHI